MGVILSEVRPRSGRTQSKDLSTQKDFAGVAVLRLLVRNYSERSAQDDNLAVFADNHRGPIRLPRFGQRVGPFPETIQLRLSYDILA
jgi:hypothetical protein